MKISKVQHAENRNMLIEVALRLFSSKGIDGVGVAEISNTAGFSHGALYSHFPSKDALLAEALSFGVRRDSQQLVSQGRTLAETIEFCLSPAQRDDIQGSCSLAAVASEVGRREKQVSTSFTEGFLQLAGMVQEAIGGADLNMVGRDRALVIVTSIIGALAVSRSVSKADLPLADDILSAVRQAVIALV